MIVELTDTNTHLISERLNQIHEERGEKASGRVLTLLIVCSAEQLDPSLQVATAASREHPCRIIAVVPAQTEPTGVLGGPGEQPGAGEPLTGQSEAGEAGKRIYSLDAQIRTGADSGAGEVIVLQPHGELTDHLDTLVLPFMLPDTPAVAWWPTAAPADPSRDPIGRMASSRLTDAIRTADPRATFERLRHCATPEDVDLSWTRLTVWRAMLASLLDQPPHLPITAAHVTGEPGHLSVWLMAAWLHTQLGVPVTICWDKTAEAVRRVSLVRADGKLGLERLADDSEQAILTTPGQAPQTVFIPLRSLDECMSEELRRLNPDDTYVKVINSDFDFEENFVDGAEQ